MNVEESGTITPKRNFNATISLSAGFAQRIIIKNFYQTPGLEIFASFNCVNKTIDIPLQTISSDATVKGTGFFSSATEFSLSYEVTDKKGNIDGLTAIFKK